MLRATLLEVRSLNRVLGPWLACALGFWILACWIQEPGFLRRSGVAFFWESLHAATVLSVAAVPFLWLLTGSPASAAAVLRASPSPLRSVFINTLSIIIYGILAATAAALFGWFLDLLGGRPDSQPLGVVARSACLLAPLAGIAPGLAHLRLSITARVLTWIGILLVHTVWFGAPGPDTPLAACLLPALLAAAAGVLLSAAVATRRITR